MDQNRPLTLAEQDFINALARHGLSISNIYQKTKRSRDPLTRYRKHSGSCIAQFGTAGNRKLKPTEKRFSILPASKGDLFASVL